MHNPHGPGAEAGYLMIDAIIALAVLTSGFLFVERSAAAQVARARALHDRVVSELATRNELAEQWVR